ncbi:MAG: STAS domain-containing protein [Leptonema sp. (in: bacteria)]
MSLNLENKQDALTNKTVFLNLRGKIYDQNALVFKKSIFSIPEEKKFLILDVSSLESLSDDGIRVFSESIRYFFKKGGITILIKPNEEIVLLLKFLNLMRFLVICNDYIQAKEIIENSIQNNNLNFQIEEKNFLFNENQPNEQPKIKPKTSEELKSIKQNLLNLNQQLVKITKKIEEKQEGFVDQENAKIFDFIEKKIEEIKKSNESYFQEFQIRIDHLNDSQKELFVVVQDLKKEIRNMQIEIQDIRKTSKTEEKVKKINGFYIFDCPKCSQPLRVKQWGKHQCPNCGAKLNILHNGEVEIFG